MIAKELDRAGIPVTQVANMIPIAEMVGSNRILRGASIVSPLGDPSISLEREQILRRHMLVRALHKLTEEVAVTM